jgi:hypothetical protein
MATPHALEVSRTVTERGAWRTAWVLALVLHAVAFLLFRSLPAPMSAKTVQRIAPIRLVFAKPGADARKSDAPHVFTELPPDRKDAAPKHADFLSNVTSRARDRVPGGDDAMPRMQGEIDAPMVKMEKDGGASHPPTPAPTPPSPASAVPPLPRAGESLLRRDPAQGGATGFTTAPPAAPRSPTATQDLAGSASSDVDQPEMDNPSGNAGLTGDVSLNTTAWDYAPWLQRFGRQLMHRWIPPPAYSIGLLKEGGWAVFELEISRAGEILRLQVLEEQGHPLLRQASEGALRNMHPIEPLPNDFPEPTLLLRIRMIYPRIHPQ